jgi:hypothetical protein
MRETPRKRPKSGKKGHDPRVSGSRDDKKDAPGGLHSLGEAGRGIRETRNVALEISRHLEPLSSRPGEGRRRLVHSVHTSVPEYAPVLFNRCLFRDRGGPRFSRGRIHPAKMEMNESNELSRETPEGIIERIRDEVARRKGVDAVVPPLPAPPKKSILQKAAAALERAKTKHLRAAKWPRLLRPLRRNQDAVNDGVIAVAQALIQEAEQLSRLTGPLAMQQAALLSQVRRDQEQIQALAERVEELETLVEKLSAAPLPGSAGNTDVTR